MNNTMKTVSTRCAGIIPLIGLRDTRPCDREHGYVPGRDTLEQLFRFMINRKNPDGTPFYDADQVATIRHTMRLRHLVGLEAGNRFHYFDEQQKWDKEHKAMGKDAPEFNKTEVARSLLDERSSISDNIETEISRLVVNGFLDRVPVEKRQFISMEDVDLGEIETEYRTKSLFMTAKKDWGMCDGKLSVDDNKVVFETSCGFNLDAIKSTEWWNVKKVKQTSTGVEVVAEPTEKYVEERKHNFMDGYLKRSLHFSSIKHLVEEMCIKRSVKFTMVDPKFTSKLCHVCHEKLGEKGAMKFVYMKKDKKEITREDAKKNHLNWRKGRTFICGNPECEMCGQEQNSDENAALNIRLRAFFKRK